MKKHWSIPTLGVVTIGVVFVSLAHSRSAVATFEPYSYNEMRLVENNQVTAEFHGKFINYLDANDEWQPIDLAFQEDVDGFHLTTAPYELHLGRSSTDDMRFVSTNRFSVSEKSIRDDAPLGKTRRFTSADAVAGKITDEGVLYKRAFPTIGADLLLQPHEMEARYLVKWDSAPVCDGTLQIPFEEAYDEGVPLLRNGQEIPSKETELKGGFTLMRNDFRGIGTPEGYIWDSAGTRQSIRIVGSYNDGVFTGKKLISCGFFEDAVFPVYTDDTDTFYPDADAETNTVDGIVVFSDHNGFSQNDWDTHHDTATGSSAHSSDAQTDFARTSKNDQGFGTHRAFLLFDTSSIGASQTVDSAELSLYVTGRANGDNDGDDFIVLVHEATPASNTNLVTGDFDQCGSVDSPTEVSNRIDIGSFTLNAYNAFTINTLSTVNTTGISRYCGREGHDVLDSPYAGGTDTENDIKVKYAETSGTSQDPKLVVTFSLQSDLRVQKSGDTEAESGSTVSYTLTGTNDGPADVTGITISDAIPSGFTFRSADSSADCSVNGSNVECGTFNLTNGASTGRTIVFDVNTGTCDVQRTNTATISGSTIIDPTPSNNTASLVTDITCPVATTAVRKTSDESVTSSTTLQNDDELKLALESGKSYAINGALFATSSSATPDIKIAFTTPSGTTMDIGFMAAFGGSLRRAELLDTSGAESSRIAIGANNTTIIQLMGTLEVGVTAGDVTLQWAQRTSNGNATTVTEGSFLSIVEIE